MTSKAWNETAGELSAQVFDGRPARLKHGWLKAVYGCAFLEGTSFGTDFKGSPKQKRRSPKQKRSQRFFLEGSSKKQDAPISYKGNFTHKTWTKSRTFTRLRPQSPALAGIARNPCSWHAAFCVCLCVCFKAWCHCPGWLKGTTAYLFAGFFYFDTYPRLSKTTCSRGTCPILSRDPF